MPQYTLYSFLVEGMDTLFSPPGGTVECWKSLLCGPGVFTIELHHVLLHTSLHPVEGFVAAPTSLPAFAQLHASLVVQRCCRWAENQ